MSNYTICAYSENKPGVLQRITILFTRRKINIESLTVCETEQQGISRFTILVSADLDLVEKVARQIERIIEVLEVKVHREEELIAREVALIEVETKCEAHRREICRIARRNVATIVSASENYLVLERAGTEEEIDELCSDLKSFKVRQFVRSGRIALKRSDEISMEETLVVEKQIVGESTLGARGGNAPVLLGASVTTTV